MRFFHLSDLHLGKRLSEIDLLPDQIEFLDVVVQAVKDKKPDALLIAGDIYDRSIPPTQAVEALDKFLTELSQTSTAVIIVSGNHDSAERLGFASDILSRNNIHISSVYNGKVEPVVLYDGFGKVNFYPLPFFKPAHVRSYFENEINDYNSAAKALIEAMNIDCSERNILIAHQFFTASGVETLKCDSESVSVGELDNIDAEIISCFDYVALGHLHRAQCIGYDYIRYCGSPIKYSLSEYDNNKCYLDITLDQKGELIINKEAMLTKHDLRLIKGGLEDLIAKAEFSEDYIWAKLTDETPAVEALNRLRTVYPNVIHIEYCQKEKQTKLSKTAANGDFYTKDSSQLFFDFYKAMLNKDINNDQLKYMNKLIDKVREGLNK